MPDDKMLEVRLTFLTQVRRKARAGRIVGAPTPHIDKVIRAVLGPLSANL